MPKKAEPRKTTRSIPEATEPRAAAAAASNPFTLHISGDPWSLVFAPKPGPIGDQGVWLFNEKEGQLWELIANTNFVLRPRQQG